MGTPTKEMEESSPNDDEVFPPFWWTEKRGETSKRPRFTKYGQEPNGIKLAPERLPYQLLSQFLPGFEHQGEGLGPPLLDARFHPIRTHGVDAQAA
jgi:hypothetical protein